MSQKSCKNFKITGTCKFGDKCRFLHGGAAPIEISQPCNYFAKFGSCKFGDSCHFLHDANLIPTDRDECKAYREQESCHLGNRCRYAHIPWSDEKKMARNAALVAQREVAKQAYIRRCMDNDGIGFTALHKVIWESNVDDVRAILSGEWEQYGVFPRDCIRRETTAPLVMEWCEYDSVDKCTDRYKLTFPVGTTALKVTRATTNKLDADSPMHYAVVDHLYDSQSGSKPKREIERMLLEYLSRIFE